MKLFGGPERWAGSVSSTTLIACLVLVIAVAGQTSQSDSDQRVNASTEVFQLPGGISYRVWHQRIPPNNPMTPVKAALGQALYFDKRLSTDGTVSCATCH